MGYTGFGMKKGDELGQLRLLATRRLCPFKDYVRGELQAIAKSQL